MNLADLVHMFPMLVIAALILAVALILPDVHERRPDDPLLTRPWFNSLLYGGFIFLAWLILDGPEKAVGISASMAAMWFMFMRRVRRFAPRRRGG